MKISHVQQKLDGFGVTSRQQHSFDAKWDYTWKIVFTEKNVSFIDKKDTHYFTCQLKKSL